MGPCEKRFQPYREGVGGSFVVLARYDFGALPGLPQSLDRRGLHEHDEGFKLRRPQMFDHLKCASRKGVMCVERSSGLGRFFFATVTSVLALGAFWTRVKRHETAELN